MLTTPSSAEVIPFQPNARTLTFAQASKTWLQQWQADRRLSHSDRTLCTQIYLHFSGTHFEKTGELLAWPGWSTLMARTALCKTSVFLRLRNLERLGALETEHGRYNHQTKKRARNLYRARESKVHLTQPCKEDQGSLSVLNQGSLGRTRLGDRDSVNLRKKEGSKVQSVEPREGSEERGLPRREEKPSGPTAPPNSQPLSTPIQASEGVSRAAPNGGGDDVWVQYDSHQWDLIERFGHRAVGKVFMRFGRLDGDWFLKSDLRAIEVLAEAEGAT